VGFIVVLLYLIILGVLLVQLRHHYDDDNKRAFSVGYLGVYVLVLPFLIVQMWAMGEWGYIMLVLTIVTIGYFTKV